MVFPLDLICTEKENSEEIGKLCDVWIQNFIIYN
jgi:hypothetical protein